MKVLNTVVVEQPEYVRTDNVITKRPSVDPYLKKLKETPEEDHILKERMERLKSITKLPPLDEMKKLKYSPYRNSKEETKIQKEIIKDLKDKHNLELNVVDIKFIFDSQFRIIPEAIKRGMGVHVPYFGRFWFNVKYRVFKEWREMHPEVDEMDKPRRKEVMTNAFLKSDLYKEANWKQKKRFKEQGLYSLTPEEQIRYFQEIVTKNDLNSMNGVILGMEKKKLEKPKIFTETKEEIKEDDVQDCS